MVFSINEFKAVIGRYGLAKSSNFAVVFSPPAGVQASIINDLPLLVHQVNLPGVQFQTENVRHKGYGIEERRAAAVQFTDLTLTIIGDGEGRVLEFLQQWMMLVMNYSGERGTSTYGTPSETFAYPEDYWGTIDLYMYDVTGQAYTIYTFNKAFPIDMGSGDLDWSTTDDFMRINVSFTYRSMSSNVTDSLTTQKSSINTQTDSPSRNLEKLEKVLSNPNLEEYQARFLEV